MEYARLITVQIVFRDNMQQIFEAQFLGNDVADRFIERWKHDNEFRRSLNYYNLNDFNFDEHDGEIEEIFEFERLDEESMIVQNV